MSIKVEQICGNCKLYDPEPSKCKVVILHEGQRINIPVDPKESCFFEQSCFDPKTGREETLNEIQQVRFWVEGKDGKKTDKNGVVKMEYPEGFFGDTTIDDII